VKLNEDVTLLSSLHEDETELFGLNLFTVDMFNPGSKHRTVLVDNTKDGVNEPENVDIITGIGNFPVFGKQASDELGLSLMLGLRDVDTRYICIKDPDFFVVYPHWIEAMKEFMEAADVGIITAPPFPTHYNKANTVTNNFIFIDTERFPKAFVNFVPSKRDSHTMLRSPKIRKWFGPKMVSRYVKNKHYDCGDQIDMRAETKIEYLTAIYNPAVNPYHTRIDKFLPKRFRFINDRTEYIYTANMTSDLEIWMWNAIPFGIHCRKFFQRMTVDDYKVPMEDLTKLVSRFIRGYRMGP
jgi:hypothetical protein